MSRAAACLKRQISTGSLIGPACLVAALAFGFGHAASAQEADGSSTANSVLKALNLKTDPGRMPEFIEKSRPAEQDFIAVGTQHPTRPVKSRTPAEIKALEAELNAAQVRNEHIAKRPHAVVPDKTPAKPRKPAMPTQN